MLNKKAFSMGQEALRSALISGFAAMPNLEVYDGNIINIEHKGRPVFIAHMDTVNDSHQLRPLEVVKGCLRRQGGGVLGADDRAGVSIILALIKANTPTNFILTRDEEVGALGAQSISASARYYDLCEKLSVPALIEFDRKGNSDIIGTFNGYCDQGLSDLVEEVSEGTYRSEHGVFTDLDYLVEGLGVQGVNLSCGYYNAHSTKEFLVLKDYEKAEKLATKLAMMEWPEVFRAEGMFDPYSYELDKGWIL